MSVVNLFSGVFCFAEEVMHGVSSRLGYPVLRDEDLISQVSESSGLKAGALRRAMYGKPSIFNQFSNDRERAVSRLKLGMAELLGQEKLVYFGYGSLLVPRTIAHVLDVCLIAEAKGRAVRGARELGLSEKDALVRIHREDEAALRWVQYLHGCEAWDPTLYDMRIGMDLVGEEEAVNQICENASSAILEPSDASRQTVRDFLLASQVEATLTDKGHNSRDLEVIAQDGKISIAINKKVMMLGRLSEELEELAGTVPGVSSVQVAPGPAYYQADIYRQADFKLPSKVLLVDDEREFVETLSERLMLREIGSAVVYDGSEALRMAAEEEPDVIVLDLKMPGIDGVEVLKRLKTDHPEMEVIILTGHGSARDREVCLQLGAFAYLEKPVDIDQLSQVMQQAYDKIRSSRG
ncbi:MAG: response regulator [Desulfarculaceae bacterium]|nr:response regulator [Desulfarculaceae bacterium]MCF8072851.1 response regulator [Desulfarculaceae bacterium]MCF8101019.1 response regulator [Desulfarculaceae bacterium]MCF8115594.1 response regulator [Desulfarculaceae bacterium]